MNRHILIAALALNLCGCEKLAQLIGDEPSRDNQARALLARGKTAAESGNLEAARQLFEKASALTATDPEPQLELGRIYARLGNDGQAILALKRAVELAPDAPEGRVLLAELYMRHHNSETATEHLRRAVESSNGEPQPEMMRRLATALLRSGNLDEAEAIVERIDAAEPGDAETLALFAEILMAKGDEERAVRLLDAAVAGNADSARVRTARAKYFYSRGKVQEALREFEYAVEAAPEDMELAAARARALATARRFDEAAQVMDAVVASRPTDLNAQASLAEIKLLAGDTDGALAMAESVLSRQPKNGRALYVRARSIELQSGDDPTRAIAAYREVIAAEPGQSEALSRLWRLHVRNGDKADAISALEHLLVVGEASPEEEVELAALYGETGINTARGKRIVEAAMRRAPGSPRLASIRRQLDQRAAEGPRSSGGGGGGGGGIQVIKGGR